MKTNTKKIIDQTRFNKKGNVPGIIFGYFFSMFAGVFAAKYAWSKRINYLGEEQFIYDKATRRHGWNMAVINVIAVTIGLIVKFLMP